MNKAYISTIVESVVALNDDELKEFLSQLKRDYNITFESSNERFNLVISNEGDNRQYLVEKVMEVCEIRFALANSLMNIIPCPLPVSFSEKEIIDGKFIEILSKHGASVDMVSTKPVLDMDEPTSYQIRIDNTGPQKLKLVKYVKELLGIGLKEAKGIVDNTPVIIPNEFTTGFIKDNNVQQSFTDIGASITLIPGKVEESVNYVIRIDNTGPQKLKLLKYVKELLGIGLKEAKGIVDSTPVIIPNELSIDFIKDNNVQQSFTDIGASITLISA